MEEDINYCIGYLKAMTFIRPILGTEIKVVTDKLEKVLEQLKTK